MDTASAPPEPQNPSAVVAAEADSTTSASTTTTPSADAATPSSAPAADAEPVKEADDDEAAHAQEGPEAVSCRETFCEILVFYKLADSILCRFSGFLRK